ncbi:MAG: pirin-like C-terminal cupin domain-containing protein [Methylocella sp.]|jgi:hypothetical protein
MWLRARSISRRGFRWARLLNFRPGDRIIVRATRRVRAIFLGVAASEGPRYIWWNFVSSRRSGSSKRKRIGRQENFHPCLAKQNSSDIGDGWQHTIKIERSIHPLGGVGYPRPI